MRVGLLTVIVAVFLTGCFDGTVRDPPGSGRSQSQVVGGKSTSQQGSPGKVKKVVRIAAVGDLAMGITPTLPPDPAAYFDPIKGELRGDVVFANLEGTLTDVSESPKCGPGSSECFAFRAPPEYARHLRAAGFTLMSNANNHSFDFGQAGQEETIEALHRAGIEQTGLPGQVTVVKVGGLKVAFLGFAPYADMPSLTDLPAARGLIREARNRADIVVVAFHAGAEGTDAQHVTGEGETYLGEDRGNPREFARMSIRAGADLILGSGPHVLRGIEIYRARLIAYSLGNFSGYHNFTLEGTLGQTAVLHVTLAQDGSFHAGRVASVQLIEEGQPVPDSTNTAAAQIATLSKEDFGSHAVNVGPSGGLTAPGDG